MTGDDFALTAGWGHFGQGEAVMPGQGRVVELPLTASETAALGETAPILGDTTFDVYLNDRAYWRNVPAAVWHYKLGGYQVLKNGSPTASIKSSTAPSTPKKSTLHQHRPPHRSHPALGAGELTMLRWKRQRSLSRGPPAAYPESGPATRDTSVYAVSY